MNKFMKLEKVEPPTNKKGFKQENALNDISGTESIVIPVAGIKFYDLYDLYEGKCEYKIYHSEEGNYWNVEVSQ